MIKLVVIEPGKPEREIVVPGNTATVGRIDGCDVVIKKPYVSKQHLRLLRGVVAVDLGSSNGTFIDGQRLDTPTLLSGSALAFGKEGVELRVEQEPEDDAHRPLAAREEAELENLRARSTLLEQQVAELRSELAHAGEGGRADQALARLRGENESLRERLESLKSELEEREIEDGGSVQARLARERMVSAQELNEQLQSEVDRLRSELDALQAPVPATPEPTDPQGLQAELARSRSETEGLRSALEQAVSAARTREDQAEQVLELRRELAHLRSAAPVAEQDPAAAQELEQARDEVQRLRTQVAELEGRLAAATPDPGQKVSDLFFRLQSENSELKRKLAAREQAGSPAPRDASTRLVKDLMEARLRITALEAEISHLKVSTTMMPSAPAVRRSVPAQRPAPHSAAGSATRGFLLTVAERDIEELVRPLDGPPEDFVVVESLRLVRHVERVVTRVAGDLIQLYQLQTMLPDTAGNYRGIVAEVLADADDRAARERLVEYLETLGRWLVASIASHRKAAVLFAEGLKRDLSEEGLIAKDPVPMVKRVSGQAGNELWRRVQTFLKELSPDTIDERIDALAREQAQQILGGRA